MLLSENRQLLGDSDGIDVLLHQLAVSYFPSFFKFLDVENLDRMNISR